MHSSGWDNFWKDQKRAFHGVMRINTTFFAVQIEKLFALNPSHEIFDYGCGPGFLADHLATRQIHITGADINELFITESRNNHPQSLFIHITTDTGENKKILDVSLKVKKFDFIVLLSIAQYFKDVETLDDVVGMLLSYLKQDGMIVIADVIDQNTSSVKDAAALLFHCIKKGKLVAFTRFMLYLIFSRYRKLSQKIKLLQISEQEIATIAKHSGLNYRRVNGLTIHLGRTNYLLTRKPEL
jgi:2-polyprenyl-3-methyl-5-hydroxy-6-metoxy-1,4-benzoquinol methylase